MTIQAQTVAAESSLAATEVPWERVDRFVGQLTHDVRNGLNALELQLTFLGEISTDPEAIQEIKLIRETVGDITRQLQAVRIATGAVSLHKLKYPAGEFFEDLRERFERNEARSKERVHWQVEVGSAELSIDPEMTMVALLELLANALYFGDPGGQLEFTASVNGLNVVASLREPYPEPPALAAEEWGRHPLQSTRRGAYGLGLFRVRRIVETQGGSYDVEHEAAARTLISTVTLPLVGVP